MSGSAEHESDCFLILDPCMRPPSKQETKQKGRPKYRFCKFVFLPSSHLLGLQQIRTIMRFSAQTGQINKITELHRNLDSPSNGSYHGPRTSSTGQVRFFVVSQWIIVYFLSLSVSVFHLGIVCTEQLVLIRSGSFCNRQFAKFVKTARYTRSPAGQHKRISISSSNLYRCVVCTIFLLFYG